MYAKIKWFWRYYRDYPHVLAILLILTPLQALVTVQLPRLVGFTIDYIKDETVPSHWLANLLTDWGVELSLSPPEMYALAFIVFGAISHALYAYFQSWRAWMNLKLEWLFRQDAFDRITSKGPDFFNTYRTGDLVTRMTDDVAEKLSWFACSGIFRLYEALVYVALIVAMMLTIDQPLTFWTAAPLPILIIVFFRSSSLLDKRYDHLQKRISHFNDVMEACFSGVRVVKAYVREIAQKKKFSDAARTRRSAEIDAVKTTTVIDSMYNYIWQFGVVVVLVAGGYRVLQTELTVGDMSTFIYYVVWLVFPMFDIGQFLVKSRQSAVSINRLVELEEVAPLVKETAAGNGRGAVKGDICFENVQFRLPGMEYNIIDGVSLAVESGQTVAVVGRVGSGKSWLVNMIPRLVDPSGGRITLDGRDLREFKLKDLRRNIGYVPQEPVLFSDTVRNNILFGREEISETVIEWAVEVAQLKEEVATFPKGIDTPIGTRGMSISGGQKQRLALARALVGKPRILILDDCTSALDSRTEATLWERLNEVLPGTTAVLITHRPDTLERANVIYVLDGGSIAESGRHAELMDREGLYARIYKRYQLAQEVGA